MWQAIAQIPQLGAVGIVTAHPCNPFCGPGFWPSEHELLQRVVDRELGQPLVVAGDFNAVDDHLPMRQLRQLGLRSATDIVGAGWLPTYPANSPIPPLIPIDHVLLDDQLTATSIIRVPVAGTDHLGLLATLPGPGQRLGPDESQEEIGHEHLDNDDGRPDLPLVTALPTARPRGAVAAAEA